MGTTESVDKFLSKPKTKMIIKDIGNGYSTQEISEMRRCSYSTIDKVRKLVVQKQ